MKQELLMPPATKRQATKWSVVWTRKGKKRVVAQGTRSAMLDELEAAIDMSGGAYEDDGRVTSPSGTFELVAALATAERAGDIIKHRPVTIEWPAEIVKEIDR